MTTEKLNFIFLFLKIYAAFVMLLIIGLNYFQYKYWKPNNIVLGFLVVLIYLLDAIVMKETWYYFWAFFWLLNTLKLIYPYNKKQL